MTAPTTERSTAIANNTHARENGVIESPFLRSTRICAEAPIRAAMTVPANANTGVRSDGPSAAAKITPPRDLFRRRHRSSPPPFAGQKTNRLALGAPSLGPDHRRDTEHCGRRPAARLRRLDEALSRDSGKGDCSPWEHHVPGSPVGWKHSDGRRRRVGRGSGGGSPSVGALGTLPGGEGVLRERGLSRPSATVARVNATSRR